MVVLSKIYTRTGDAGDTALGDGTRVPKPSPRVEAYGTVDETNATIGLARLHATGDMDAALSRIQNDLFDLGADLCRPKMEEDARAEYPPLRMIASQVDRLRPCRPSAPLPHRLAQGRASRRRPDGRRGLQPRRGEIPQPPVRLVLRGQPGRQ